MKSVGVFLLTTAAAVAVGLLARNGVAAALGGFAVGLLSHLLERRLLRHAEVPWAGNMDERLVKQRGWGFYASHIGAPGNIYMRRFILLLPWGATLRLHHIMRSDDDRHLHDHPFDFTSFLLTAGYVETTRGPVPGFIQAHFWPRFSIVRKRAEDLHCLSLAGPVWTLVFAGPKRREWGFATERGWISNHRYLDEFPARAEWRDQPGAVING